MLKLLEDINKAILLGLALTALVAFGAPILAQLGQ